VNKKLVKEVVDTIYIQLSFIPAVTKHMWKIEKKLSYKISRNTILFLFIIAGVTLSILSIFVRDVEYIIKYPFKFCVELVVIGILSAVPVYLIARTRKSSYKRATRDFFVLVLQFILFWVLTEISGVNSYLFPRKST
jgi:hypothetical protein